MDRKPVFTLQRLFPATGFTKGGTPKRAFWRGKASRRRDAGEDTGPHRRLAAPGPQQGPRGAPQIGRRPSRLRHKKATGLAHTPPPGAKRLSLRPRTAPGTIKKTLKLNIAGASPSLLRTKSVPYAPLRLQRTRSRNHVTEKKNK